MYYSIKFRSILLKIGSLTLWRNAYLFLQFKVPRTSTDREPRKPDPSLHINSSLQQNSSKKELMRTRGLVSTIVDNVKKNPRRGSCSLAQLLVDRPTTRTESSASVLRCKHQNPNSPGEPGPVTRPAMTEF